MMFVLGISIYVTWHKEMCLPVSQDDAMAKGFESHDYKEKLARTSNSPLS